MVGVRRHPDVPVLRGVAAVHELLILNGLGRSFAIMLT